MSGVYRLVMAKRSELWTPKTRKRGLSARYIRKAQFVRFSFLNLENSFVKLKWMDFAQFASENSDFFLVAQWTFLKDIKVSALPYITFWVLGHPNIQFRLIMSRNWLYSFYQFKKMMQDILLCNTQNPIKW